VGYVGCITTQFCATLRINLTATITYYRYLRIYSIKYNNESMEPNVHTRTVNRKDSHIVLILSHDICERMGPINVTEPSLLAQFVLIFHWYCLIVSFAGLSNDLWD
jgi:hypothetical protein